MKKMEVNYLRRSILGIPLLKFCFTISSTFVEPSFPRLKFDKNYFNYAVSSETDLCLKCD